MGYSLGSNVNKSFCSLASTDRRKSVFYAPAAEISKEKMDWKHLFKREDEVYNFIATEKELYVRTPKEASNFKILKTSLKNPDLANAEVVIPENPLASLRSFKITNEGICFILYKNGVQKNLYRLFYGENKSVEIELPSAASILSLSTKGVKFSDVCINLSGWADDYQRYRYLHKNN